MLGVQRTYTLAYCVSISNAEFWVFFSIIMQFDLGAPGDLWTVPRLKRSEYKPVATRIPYGVHFYSSGALRCP